MDALGFASNYGSHLDPVSTGSGSDLVVISSEFLRTYSHGLTRSLPLPVLTGSKCES